LCVHRFIARAFLGQKIVAVALKETKQEHQSALQGVTAMSVLSIARSALAQRGALRKARRLAHARDQFRQALARSPLVWACGLMLIAFAAAWD